MDFAVVVDNLHKRYAKDRDEALRGLSLSVPAGMLFGLIGADGAGKSTLLTILSTLAAADSGKATVLGFDAATQSRSIRTSIGYMPQKFSLYQDLTVIENLLFFADVFGVHGAERAQRLERLLSFSRLGPFTARRAAKLSGGMKQKLSLCCALMHAPRLLILDEPTTGVDPVSRGEFWQILQELAKEGVTILVSTPYMDETRYCGRIAILHRGAVLCEGTVAELLAAFGGSLFRVARSESAPLLASDTKLAEGLVRMYPSGSELRVAADKRLDPRTAVARIRDAVPDATAVEPVAPRMEDVFIERVSD